MRDAARYNICTHVELVEPDRRGSASSDCVPKGSASSGPSTPRRLISLWSGALTSTSDSASEKTALQSDSVTVTCAGTSYSCDQQSSSESDSGQCPSGSFLHFTARQPPHIRRKQQKLCFMKEWTLSYLMLQASTIQSSDSSTSSCDEEMICIQCQERMKTKSRIARRHIEQKHPTMVSGKEEKTTTIL